MPEGNGSIPVDTNLVFFPLINVLYSDYTDDANSTIPACTETARGTPGFLNDVLESRNMLADQADYFVVPSATRNSEDLNVFWFVTEAEIFMSDCPDGSELCDGCDEPSCVEYGGIDAFPNHGWRGYDTKTWTCGEKRVYILSADSKSGDDPANPDHNCPSVKYTLTADKCTPADASDTQACSLLVVAFLMMASFFI